MSDEQSEGPKQRYAAAERAWQAGDAGAALAMLEALVLEAPDHPNAHNLAGWILRTALASEPDALARAIVHFQAARVHEPWVGASLCNLGDALLAAGRDGEAIAAMEADLVRDPTNAYAHNWLGWYRLERKGDVDGALVHLERATKIWFGPAHLNRGRALEAKGDLAGALRSYEMALSCRDLHDSAFVHSRLAAFARERGHLRRALSGFRAAAWHERKKKGARLTEIMTAAEGIEDALLQRGDYFAHARDESGWIEHAEAVRHEDGDDPRRKAPTAGEMCRLVDNALVLLKGSDAPPVEPMRFALQCMREIAEAKTLPYRLAGVRLVVDPTPVEPKAAKRTLGEVALAWPRFHRLLWIRLLDREEPTQPEGPRATLARAIASGAHDDALAQLAELAKDIDGLFSCVDLAEAAGDDARVDGDPALATKYWHHALDAWQWYASCSSSGGEGLARMLDVNRVKEKLAGVSESR